VAAPVRRDLGSDQFARIEEIRFSTSLNVDPVVVEEDKLQKLLSKTLDKSTRRCRKWARRFRPRDLDITSDEQESEAAGCRRDDVRGRADRPVRQQVMLDAIKKGASDITSNRTKRLSRTPAHRRGAQGSSRPTVQLSPKISARIKVMARLDIAERRVPQDVASRCACRRIARSIFASSTCPTLFGEKTVMLILDPSSAMPGSNRSGMSRSRRDLPSGT